MSSAAAPGFRFYPTEEELLGFYLRNKLESRRVDDIDHVIPTLDVYGFHPSHLPQMSGERCARDSIHWFFFCPMQEKEAHGGRPTRRTPDGFWKATGSPSLVYSRRDVGQPIGVKKTMVFYEGRAPNGTKTHWKMNEYKLLADDDGAGSTVENPKCRNEYSLCRVYVRSGSMRSFDRRPSASQSCSRSADAQSSRIPEVTSSSAGTSVGVVTPEGPIVDMDWDMFGDLDWDVLDSI